jgi:hypothetical protein
MAVLSKSKKVELRFCVDENLFRDLVEPPGKENHDPDYGSSAI